MPQIRHIALATNDPDKTAEFYKQGFGFREIARTKKSDDPKQVAYGIYLSDGTLNLAILKFKNVDQLGRGLDYVGLHHFGIQVADNLEDWIKKLETLGAECFMRRPESLKDVFFETKFRGPDGVVFDVSEHPWGAPSRSRNWRRSRRANRSSKRRSSFSSCRTGLLRFARNDV